MPHVAFIPLTGFRIREEAMLELGMSLPGFRKRGAAIGQLPALGLLTLAGMLPAEWSCSYHPAGRVDEELVEAVCAERPTLVAISALSASIEEAYRLSMMFCERGIATVLGGLHVTACPEEALRFGSAIVVGDGEPVWRRVLADAERGELRGIYQAKGDAEPVEWVQPRFDLLGKSIPRWTLQTQRGCPWACEFCGASRLLGGFREKPTERIRNEIHRIRELDPTPLIELADDNTFAGSRDAEELLSALGESGGKWFTEADWRIGERSELLAGLARAGCMQVLVGIESLVLRYPGMGKKQAELARIMEAVEAIQGAGVAVNGCFIVGAEGETRESLARLIEFLKGSPFAEVQVTLQTPFPGTGLYRKLKEERRLLPDRGWSHYTLFDVTYQPDRMSVADLELGFREVLREVFGERETNRREGIRRKILERNRELRRKETG